MAHVAAPSRGSKGERAKVLLDHALAARAALEASTELRCHACNRHVMNYDPPVARLTFPCRRCGTWIDFSTERSP
jgi:hypothetical protein